MQAVLVLDQVFDQRCRHRRLERSGRLVGQVARLRLDADLVLDLDHDR